MQHGAPKDSSSSEKELGGGRSSEEGSSSSEELPDRPKRVRKAVDSFTYAAKGETESSEMERQLKQIARASAAAAFSD